MNFVIIFIYRDKRISKFSNRIVNFFRSHTLWPSTDEGYNHIFFFKEQDIRNIFEFFFFQENSTKCKRAIQNWREKSRKFPFLILFVFGLVCVCNVKSLWGTIRNTFFFPKQLISRMRSAIWNSLLCSFQSEIVTGNLSSAGLDDFSVARKNT